VTTTYRVLYWQEVPSQIKAEDDQDEITVLLPHRFQDRIDRLAGERGLAGSDDYLAEWHWGDDLQREGTAAEVAAAVQAELEAAADW
jgi:hypothetical protein